MTFNYYTQSTVYPKHHCRSFYQLVWHPFNCVWLIGPSSVTERASDDECLGSLDDTIFYVMLSRVENWPDWGPNYSVASFSCLRELQCTANRWRVYCELSFQSHYRFTALVQRISNCSKIRNTILTPDKVLNILLYGLLCSDQIQYVEERLKWS